MFIAVEMKKLLEERATVDAKVIESLPFKMFCRPEDPMCVADHVWLNGLKNIEYRDAMRSGNEMLDAGMTAGTLLGEGSDGIYITELENLLSSKTASNGKVTVSFVGSLKEAMDIYKKSEKIPVKRTKKARAVAPIQEKVEEVKAETPEEAPKAVETQEIQDEAAGFTESPFPMPVPEEDIPVEETAKTEESVQEDEVSFVKAEEPVQTVEENPFLEVVQETAEEVVAEDVQKTETPAFPLKDQSDRSKALNFDVSGYPVGPEFDQFKKAAIGCGVSNANVPYALTALQISEGADDLLHSLVIVFGNYKSEAYATYDTLRSNFDKMKLYADQVTPFEIRV